MKITKGTIFRTIVLIVTVNQKIIQISSLNIFTDGAKLSQLKSVPL